MDKLQIPIQACSFKIDDYIANSAAKSHMSLIATQSSLFYLLNSGVNEQQSNCKLHVDATVNFSTLTATNRHDVSYFSPVPRDAGTILKQITLTVFMLYRHLPTGVIAIVPKRRILKGHEITWGYRVHHDHEVDSSDDDVDDPDASQMVRDSDKNKQGMSSFVSIFLSTHKYKSLCKIMIATAKTLKNRRTSKKSSRNLETVHICMCVYRCIRTYSYTIFLRDCIYLHPHRYHNGLHIFYCLSGSDAVMEDTCSSDTESDGPMNSVTTALITQLFGAEKTSSIQSILSTNKFTSIGSLKTITTDTGRSGLTSKEREVLLAHFRAENCMY